VWHKNWCDKSADEENDGELHNPRFLDESEGEQKTAFSPKGARRGEETSIRASVQLERKGLTGPPCGKNQKKKITEVKRLEESVGTWLRAGTNVWGVFTKKNAIKRN